MWRFRDFTISKGHVGRFEVFSYSENDTYDYCKVVVYCRTEAAGTWITNALHQIALSTFVGPDFKYEFTSIAKKCRRPGPNFGKTELSFILNMKHNEAANKLARVGVPPEELEVKADKISVGPCAFLADGKKYVKVRFNGMSVRFYFDDNDWLPVETEKSTTCNIGGVAADGVYKLLADHASMLHKRAVTRPLNFSEVEDYAHHNLTILKGDASGCFYPASNAEIAEPDAKLAYVFDYGYNHIFAVINDVFYKVAGFISGYQLYTNPGAANLDPYPGTYNLVFKTNGKTYNGYMRSSDCTLLDPRDQFVKEKITRSMKAKL